MSYDELNDGDLFGIQRGKINAMFQELYSVKLEASQVLTKTNTSVYTPTLDYHPATKLYADQLRTNWETVYDPDGINANMFDRSNHTGTQDPSTINTDSNNRFVTDVQIANWDQKADYFGTINTAFNKNFGTTAGTVSEGNHMHTKSDLGLGNVDNTSDLDKPISTATQTALDTKLENTVANFTPQLNPTHAEGNVFYDSETKTLVVHNDIPGTALDVGREQRIRIKNKSGATLTNGQICRHDGVDAATGLPKVVLAIADTIPHSRVLGVVTESIDDDDEGELTTFGSVGMDLSSFPAGVPLYLSDTIAGTMVEEPPDLVTQVGGGLVSAVDGKLFTSIINHIALPTLIAVLQDTGTTSFSVTTSYQDIKPFSISDFIGIPINPTTGHITIPGSGWYRITINITASITPQTPATDNVFLLRLYNSTTGIASSGTTLIIHDDVPTGSRSISGLFQAVEGDDLVLQIALESGSRVLVFDTISYDLTSVNIK